MPSENSLMEDDAPMVPTVEPKSLDSQQTPPEWKKLSQLPDFHDYLESRIKFYQEFLPTGEPIAKIEKKEDLLTAWQNATVLIRELQTIKNTAELMVDGKKND